jgi:hypothetical protein
VIEVIAGAVTNETDGLWKTVQEGLPPLITELEKLVPNEMD